jgi:ERCC4-type nuclease
MLVSPTESPAARALGTSSWKAEEFGVDFWWIARKQMYGVQRKALSDFCASVDDGRLATERLQMYSLDHAFLILETGERGGAAPREMPNGQLGGGKGWGRPWTGAQVRGVCYGLMADGIHVVMVRDEAETIARVRELEAWSKKASHGSARGRGTTPRNVFGERGNKEYGVWLLRSLPGVGAEMAGRIWDHFGGLPMQMREGIGVKELCQVPGVWKVTVQRVLDVFGERE